MVVMVTNSGDLEGAFLDGLDLDLEHSLTPTGGGGGGVLPKQVERKWKQQFLINPLTGDLEETQVEETVDDNDEDAAKNFPEFHSEMSNSLYSDDDNSCSTGFSKFTSDISDTERSNTMDGASSSGFANAVSVGAATMGTATLVGKLGKPAKVKKEKLKDGSKSSAKTKEKKPREKKSALKQIKTKAKIVTTESGFGAWRLGFRDRYRGRSRSWDRVRYSDRDRVEQVLSSRKSSAVIARWETSILTMMRTRRRSSKRGGNSERNF